MQKYNLLTAPGLFQYFFLLLNIHGEGGKICSKKNHNSQKESYNENNKINICSSIPESKTLKCTNSIFTLLYARSRRVGSNPVHYG